MNSNLIVKNTAPDPATPKSKTKLLAEVPEESVWLANFISQNKKRTYLLAVREFIAFHEITSVDELPQIDQAHIITWRNDLIDHPGPSTRGSRPFHRCSSTCAKNRSPIETPPSGSNDPGSTPAKSSRRL